MASTQYQIFCRYLNEDIGKIVSNTSTKEWVSAEEWYECKVAYNATSSSQVNAKTITNDSPNTGVPAGSTYRLLYDALVAKMNTSSGNRLRYESLTTEEKLVYDLCTRYKEIIKKVGNGECVIEHAMIRPNDELYNDNNNTLLKAAKALDSKLHDVIFNQISKDNDKYNMMFTYKGMVQTEEQITYYQLGNSFKQHGNIAGPPIPAFNPNQSSTAEVPSTIYEGMERLKLDPWFLITTCNSLKAAMTKAEQLIKIYGKEAVKIGKVVPLDQYIDIV